MSNRDESEDLLSRLRSPSAKVAVIGLGYVGLPLAVAMARAGHSVTGIDLAEARVRTINSAKSPIEDISDADLEPLVASGRLRAASSFDAAAGADVAVIAVPTPIDEYRVPDLRAVAAAATSLASVLRPGSLVILESTTYPGTTEEIVMPAFSAAGLEPGRDVFIGYSPERIDPGNQRFRVTNTPKVVSGLGERDLELTSAFYGAFIDTVVPVSSLRTAEITKLFENIFRIVNIALVNEFQQICDAFEIDVWEVLRACATKPYGYMPFFPGPGLGGHCVPVDPFYLAWKARELRVNTEFIELAGRVNAQMPNYVIGKIAAALNADQRSLAGSRVGLLGVAYKKNTADVRESPSVRIVELLRQANAEVTFHDPLVASLRVGELELTSQPLTEEYVASQDCLVVVADHDAIDWDLVARGARRVVDTRNVLGGRASAAGAGAAAL